jgi:hypothetical protein
MPHYFRSHWAFRISVCWWIVPIFVNALLDPRKPTTALGTFRAILSPIQTFVACYGSLIPMIRGQSLYLVNARGFFYAGYAIAITWIAREKDFDPPSSGWLPSSHFELAELFASAAAITYWLAQWAGHDYVFSRTLGGPGVELMNLVRTGRGPRYDSIGQEEGAIRLP